MPALTPTQLVAMVVLLVGLPALCSLGRSLLGPNREWRRLLAYEVFPFVGLGVMLVTFGLAAERQLKSGTMPLIVALLLICYGSLALMRTDWMINPGSSPQEAERDRAWFRRKGASALIMGTLGLIVLYCTKH